MQEEEEEEDDDDDDNEIELIANIKLYIYIYIYIIRSRPHWPCSLRRGTKTSRFLGLRVQIPPGTWMSLLRDAHCLADHSSRGVVLSVVCPMSVTVKI